MECGDHFKDRSAGVTFITKDLEVRAACASGCTESSHLEMPTYCMELLLLAGDCSCAEIVIKVKQRLPEDDLLAEQMQGQERSAGSSPQGSLKVVCRKRQESRTPSDGTDKEDQGEASFSDPLSPRGVRSSRKRPKKQRRQPPAPKTVETTEVEKETLMLENGKNQAEATEEETIESLIPMPVKIVVFAILVVLIFMRIINGG